jgi:hypothetical protein
MQSRYYRLKKETFEHVRAEDEESEEIEVGKVYSSETTNTKAVAVVHPTIHTLDGLLDYCKVDLDEWVVERHLVNGWPGWRGDKKIDLKWKKGTMSGMVKDTGDITQQQLIQVKAWLIRKKPVPIFPHLQAVESAVKHKSVPLSMEKLGSRKELLIADPHFGFRWDRGRSLSPFHSRSALDITLQLSQVMHPDVIRILGDTMDLGLWTDKYLREPDMSLTTQPGFIEAHWWLAQLRAQHPDIPIVVYMGNHDKRMPVMTSKHLKAAYELRPADRLDGFPVLSVPYLLGFESLGIEWVDGYPEDASDWISDSTEVEHGTITRTGIGDTGKAILDGRTTSVFYGHKHTPETSTKVIKLRNRRYPIQAICPGCLCKTNGEVPGHNRKTTHWVQGIGEVFVDEDQWLFNYNGTIIHEGQAFYRGTLFTARDRVEEIRATYPGWGF